MELITPEGKQISPEMAKDAIRQLASADDSVRQRAFAALSTPLRAAAPQESSVRNIFETVVLGAQEDAIFPVDTDELVEVVLATTYGTPPVSMFITDVVTVPTDTYQGGWTLPENLVAAGRIDQVARNSKRMLDAFTKMEETQGWAVIKAAISSANTTTLSTTTLSVELINEAIVYFQENNMNCDKCFISPRSMGDLRLYCKEAGLADAIKTDLWRQGILRGLWGIDFYVLKSVADNEVYFFDTSEFGVMPIRQELETREDPSARAEFKIRVYGQQQAGFCAIKKPAVLKGAITRSA